MHRGQQGPISTTCVFLIILVQVPDNDERHLCPKALGRHTPVLC